MIQEVSYITVLAATLSPAIPLTIILIKIGRQPLEFRRLAAYLGLSFGCDILGQILARLQMNPNIAGTTWGIFSIVVLSYFFAAVINRPNLKKLLVWINILYFCFAFSNIFFLQKAEMNTYSSIFQCLFTLFFCIIYFYNLLQDLPTQQLHKLALFWVVSAFFFSYAGKMVIYAFTHYLVKYEGDNLEVIWTFHNLLTVIGNLILAYAAWLNHLQTKSSPFSLERSE